MAGLNLKGDTSGSVEIVSPAIAGDTTLTLPATDGTVLVEPSSGGVSIADSITHTGDTDTSIRFPAADTFTVETAGSERLRVTSGGNVGIGTDNPVNALLEVRNTSMGNLAQFRSFTGTAKPLLNITSSEDGVTLVEDGSVYGAIMFNTGAAERLRIAGNGNVGIGTDNPTTKVEVQSSANDSLDNPQTIFLRDRNTAGQGKGPGLTFGFDYNAAGNHINRAGQIKCIKENSTDGNYASALIFGTTQNGASTAERVRITSDGLFGIGTTAPGNNLEVRGDANNEGITIKSTGNSSNSLIFDANRTGSSAGISQIISRWNGTDVGQIQVLTGSDTSNKDDAHMLFSTNSGSGMGERMRIRSDGIVEVKNDPGAITVTSTDSTPSADQSIGEYRFGVSALDLDVASIQGHAAATWAGTVRPTYLSFLTRSSAGGASPTERMRIDSSGRLLVGTTTSSSNATIVAQGNSNNAASSGELFLQRGETTPPTTGGLGTILFADSGGGTGASIHGARDEGSWSASSKPSRLVFSTTADGASSPTERMRIASDGDITFGAGMVNRADENITSFGNMLTLTDYDKDGMVINNTGRLLGSQSSQGLTSIVLYQRGTATTQYMLEFFRKQVQGGGDNSYDFVGSITTNFSNTSYNTGSDYRLKENVVDLVGAIDRVKQLQPRRFNFIKNPSVTLDGFVAHEAQNIVPESVTGVKDEVRDVGNIVDANGKKIETSVAEPEELEEGQTWTKTGTENVYQGIDQSKLVPLLTAALQEAIAEIETLKTKVAALEGS